MNRIASPVVLFIYNRVATTARVIAALRLVRPPRLFIVADGAASADDQPLCQAARALVSTIDWDCEITTIYAETHLGIKGRVESGLEAVFAQSDRAIILEDDCVPHGSFFGYCDLLLDRYADDERIMSIGGSNLNLRRYSAPNSYYFSRYAICWGWATWRRAWQRYDPAMSAWPELGNRAWLAARLGSPRAVYYWQKILGDNFTSGENWDYNWQFSCWLHNALSIVPAVNLISNIGFGHAATHTFDVYSPFSRLAAAEMHFPLRHPAQVARDEAADEVSEQTAFSHPYLQAVFTAAHDRIGRDST